METVFRNLNLRPIFVAAIFSAFALIGTTSGQLVWKSAEGPYGNIETMAYGNGAFVAITDNGLAFRSTDGGETWTSHSTGFGSSLGRRLIFDGTRFVIGSGNRVATSPDGETWTAIKINPAGEQNPYGETIGSIRAYANGLYFAMDSYTGSFVTPASHVYSSPDLVNWTHELQLVGWDGGLAANADGSQIVAASLVSNGSGGSTSRSLYQRTESGNWEAIPNAPTVQELSFAYGIFISQANPLQTSVDGLTWQNAANQSFNGSLVRPAIEFDNRIVILTQTGFLHSTNGSVFLFNQIPLFGGGLMPQAHATDGERVVIATDSGAILITEDLVNVRPATGTNLIATLSPDNNDSPKVLQIFGDSGAGRFGIVQRSTGGQVYVRSFNAGLSGTWEEANGLPTSPLDLALFRPFYYAGRYYLRSKPLSEGGIGMTFSSLDGIDWQASTHFNSGEHSATRHVNGSLWNLPFGDVYLNEQWTQRNESSLAFIFDAAYAGQQYFALSTVANGSKLQFVMSDDDVDWISFDVPEVASGYQQLFVVGDQAVVPSSSSVFVASPVSGMRSILYEFLVPPQQDPSGGRLAITGVAQVIDGILASSTGNSEASTHSDGFFSEDGIAYRPIYGLPLNPIYSASVPALGLREYFSRAKRLAVEKSGNTYYALTLHGTLLTAAEADEAESDIQLGLPSPTFEVGQTTEVQVEKPEWATSVLVSDLPAGLQIDVGSGLISGTPVRTEVVDVWLTFVGDANLAHASTVMAVTEA
ncbi:MAG: hypothetical protein WA771_11290, partial [Chthoniobacterales bacterium]